jgi:hypothetical protein
MFARLAPCSALFIALLGAHDPAPVPTPSPDVEGERIFAKVREVWRTRADVPYVRYGALERYQHGSHVVDSWYDVYYRTSDGAMKLEQLHDVPAENARLKGFAFSIFGASIFDTNSDATPIRVDEPRIEPDSSFGLKTRFAATLTLASPAPAASAAPSPLASDALREITHVESNTRAYQVDVVGPETVLGASTVHLHMTPLHDPTLNRLRDLWVDPATYRTVQLRVQGLLNGKPYDGVAWTVRYVVLEGRSYVQQISADAPLKFGLDESIPKFEFDFVDYQFPDTVPKFTFESWTPFRLQD